ncbi:MAG: cytochrome c oxidase subunit I, partial [Rhodothermales bacterium]
EKASANPWHAATLEWTHTGRRPSPHNFHRTPLVTHGPYDYYLAGEVFGDGVGNGSPVGDTAPSEEARSH